MASPASIIARGIYNTTRYLGANTAKNIPFFKGVTYNQIYGRTVKEIAHELQMSTAKATTARYLANTIHVIWEIPKNAVMNTMKGIGFALSAPREAYHIVKGKTVKFFRGEALETFTQKTKAHAEGVMPKLQSAYAELQANLSGAVETGKAYGRNAAKAIEQYQQTVAQIWADARLGGAKDAIL